MDELNASLDVRETPDTSLARENRISSAAARPFATASASRTDPNLGAAGYLTPGTDSYQHFMAPGWKCDIRFHKFLEKPSMLINLADETFHI